MIPKLHPRWRDITRRAWSVRLLVLAGVLTGLEAVISAFDLADFGISSGVRALITFFVIAAAFVARLLAQQGLD